MNLFAFQAVLLHGGEYLICEFSCVLSSVGGYVGLFFGVSVLDFVFLGEWVVGKFTGFIQKYNKNI